MNQHQKQIVSKYVGRLGMKSHFASALLRVSENEIAEVLEDEAIELRKIEKDYLENELPKVQQSQREWLAEFPEQERLEMKRVYLLEQIKELKNTPEDPRLPKLMREAKIFTGRLEGLSPEKIAKAMEYPIGDLIKSVRGIALCPFHDDKTPSMDVRKNFYHCYGCGATGNVIDLVRHLENLTFRQAITRLT